MLYKEKLKKLEFNLDKKKEWCVVSMAVFCM